MSENTPKSASLVTVLAVLACSALFLLVVYYVYAPRVTGPFQGDGIRTAEQRKENLAKLRAHEHEAATTYGWVDQKAGVIRLPLERAKELTLRHYAAGK